MPKMMIEVDIPNGRSVAEAQGAVIRAFDPDWVAEWWHIEDVASHAECMGESLTDQECRDVLNLMMHKHDCNIGINWEVIAYWIDYVVEEREEEVCE